MNSVGCEADAAPTSHRSCEWTLVDARLLIRGKKSLDSMFIALARSCTQYSLHGFPCLAGKGRGRQVIAVARSADLVLVVVDAGSGKAERQRYGSDIQSIFVVRLRSPWVVYHRELLVNELEVVGLRLNQRLVRAQPLWPHQL